MRLIIISVITLFLICAPFADTGELEMVSAPELLNQRDASDDEFILAPYQGAPMTDDEILYEEISFRNPIITCDIKGYNGECHAYVATYCCIRAWYPSFEGSWTVYPFAQVGCPLDQSIKVPDLNLRYANTTCSHVGDIQVVFQECCKGRFNGEASVRTVMHFNRERYLNLLVTKDRHICRKG